MPLPAWDSSRPALQPWCSHPNKCTYTGALDPVANMPVLLPQLYRPSHHITQDDCPRARTSRQLRPRSLRHNRRPQAPSAQASVKGPDFHRNEATCIPCLRRSGQRAHIGQSNCEAPPPQHPKMVFVVWACHLQLARSTKPTASRAQTTFLSFSP